METAVRHLTRSRKNRVFAGVCGGLAGYLGWDTVLVRVAYVALTVLSFGGAGILLYLFAWLVIPLGDDQPVAMPEERSPKSHGRAAIGVLLVVVGALALADSFMPWFWHIFSVHVVASAVLIALGLVVIFWKTGEPATPRASEQPNTAPSETPPQAASVRRLVRLQRGRKIAGVCAGLGRHFAVDPTVVRLLFVVLLLAGGGGLLLYLILWIIMPLEIS